MKFSRYIKGFLVFIGLLYCSLAYSIEIKFPGNESLVVSSVPSKSTGLDYVYTVKDINLVKNILITGLQTDDVSIQIYSNLGGGFAEDFPFTITENCVMIENPKGESGYIIRSGNETFAFWIINYFDKSFAINSISSSSDSDCDKTVVNIDGIASPLYYYSLNGKRNVLSREITISYDNLMWNQDINDYELAKKTQVVEFLGTEYSIVPPLYCNSTIEVVGDRFSKAWGAETIFTSELLHFSGVAVNAIALQSKDDSIDESNVIKGQEFELGGSAPVEIKFKSFFTDGVMHYEWQVARDPDFYDLQYRFNDRDLNINFTEAGKQYVRFIGSNADGSCIAISDPFEINISTSELQIPNAFSPNGDGINDIWKVGYRSLVEFKCSIFDRNGLELYSFDNPAQGWDGRYKGKIVPSGVYYYVIEAKGGDGIIYKKGGDINIVSYRSNSAIN